MHDRSRVVVILIFLLPLVAAAATAVMLSFLISLSNTLFSLVLVDNETRHLLFLLLV